MKGTIQYENTEQKRFEKLMEASRKKKEDQKNFTEQYILAFAKHCRGVSLEITTEEIYKEFKKTNKPPF
jgi:glucose-6-phosphate 1-dehydrogenase